VLFAPGRPGLVARVLDRRDLHAEADAEVRNAVLAGELRGEDLALDAALAEAARHQDRIEAAQVADVRRVQVFRIDVLDLDPRVVVDAGVAQRLVQRLVRVGQIDVLAAHRDRDLVLRVLDLVHEVVPARQVGRLRVQVELRADQLVEPLRVQHARHLVDRVGVPHRDHAELGHVREQRDLRALVVGDRPVGAAEQGVRHDADLAQLLHAVLGRLGLQLAGGGDPRHQGQVQERAVGRAHAQAHLAHRLEERQRFDVADRCRRSRRSRRPSCRRCRRRAARTPGSRW
jgi:hypothetical protein